MARKTNGKFLAVLALVLAAALLLGCAAEAPAPKTQENYGKSQVKLTWVGPQRKTIPSMGMAAENFDLGKFTDKTKGIDYSNDEADLREFEIGTEKMKSVVTAAKGLDFIEKDMELGREPALSYMHYNGGTGEVTERLLDGEQAEKLAETLKGRLAGNDKAVAVLETYG